MKFVGFDCTGSHAHECGKCPQQYESEKPKRWTPAVLACRIFGPFVKQGQRHSACLSVEYGMHVCGEQNNRLAHLKAAADECLADYAAIDAATCEAELPPHLR